MTSVGLVAVSRYAPDGYMTASEISALCAIPEEILVDRFGLTGKHVSGPDVHVSDMAVAAATRLLEDNDVDPSSIDAVVYNGSYWKDFDVWSASPHIAHRLGATNAFALELINVSAGTPVALKVVGDMMRSDETLNTVLICGGCKEAALIDYTNQRARFMFNFGDGGAAALLQRNSTSNELLGSCIRTDGRFALDVRVPAGGSVNPTSHETVDRRMHKLDVRDPGEMKLGLDSVTIPNFIHVAQEAVARSGHTMDDLAFVLPIHVKRSLHETLVSKLGLELHQSVYLHDWGHMSALDPLVSLSLAQQSGMLKTGDLVCLLAAGTGYTWAATCLRWGDAPR